MLQEDLGSKFDVCSIFSRNVPFAEIVKDSRKLGKDLIKQGHIVVGRLEYSQK
jgi:hypothetical protein